MELLPPLEWVEGFVRSLNGALGTNTLYTLSKTVNPLVYKIKLKFQEQISGRNKMLVWNLLQMYASKNDCIPQGKVSDKDTELVADIAIKRRLGPSKNAHPLE